MIFYNVLLQIAKGDIFKLQSGDLFPSDAIRVELSVVVVDATNQHRFINRLNNHEGIKRNQEITMKKEENNHEKIELKHEGINPELLHSNGRNNKYNEL